MYDVLIIGCKDTNKFLNSVIWPNFIHLFGLFLFTRLADDLECNLCLFRKLDIAKAASVGSP